MQSEEKAMKSIIPDMLLPDEHSSMVDGLGHTRLKHESLETTLKEILHSKSQDIIELVLTLIQETISVHSPKESLSFKNPTRILLIEC